jgi:hypothetical protein
LLDNEELLKEKNNKHVQDAYDKCQLTGQQPAPIDSLNLSSGLSKTLFDQAVEYKARENAKNTAAIERADEIRQKAVESFNTAICMTAGIAFNAGHCVLDETMRDRVREIHKIREEKQVAKAVRKEEAEASLKRKVEKAKSKGGPEKWTGDDLKAMVSWFKRPGDSKMPTKKVDLLRRYQLTCIRREEERNRLKEGEEPLVDEGEGEDGGGGDVVGYYYCFIALAAAASVLVSCSPRLLIFL